ncbi:MAG: glycosyltransferase family 2 protein, partial [Planctomycetaceae bacterium]
MAEWSAVVVWGSCGAACFAMLQFFVSVLMFRRAPSVRDLVSAKLAVDSVEPEVSVLIPARTESARIGRLLKSVLLSRGVCLEVCVLDDDSTDGTAEIVQGFAAADSRVRLLRGERMPEGWNGKQHACWQLSMAARTGELIFLEADVELSSDALMRTVLLRRRLGVSLLSGFPR